MTYRRPSLYCHSGVHAEYAGGCSFLPVASLDTDNAVVTQTMQWHPRRTRLHVLCLVGMVAVAACGTSAGRGNAQDVSSSASAGRVAPLETRAPLVAALQPLLLDDGCLSRGQTLSALSAVTASFGVLGWSGATPRTVLAFTSCAAGGHTTLVAAQYEFLKDNVVLEQRATANLPPLSTYARPSSPVSTGRLTAINGQTAVVVGADGVTAEVVWDVGGTRVDAVFTPPIGDSEATQFVAGVAPT